MPPSPDKDQPRAKQEAPKREDLETIKKRLSVYQNQTYPVKEYYKRLDRFYKVDGDRSIDEVYENLKKIIYL